MPKYTPNQLRASNEWTRDWTAVIDSIHFLINNDVIPRQAGEDAIAILNISPHWRLDVISHKLSSYLVCAEDLKRAMNNLEHIKLALNNELSPIMTAAAIQDKYRKPEEQQNDNQRDPEKA